MLFCGDRRDQVRYGRIEAIAAPGCSVTETYMLALLCITSSNRWGGGREKEHFHVRHREEWGWEAVLCVIPLRQHRKSPLWLKIALKTEGLPNQT